MPKKKTAQNKGKDVEHPSYGSMMKPSEKKSESDVVIRSIKEDEAESAAELMARLKRLNGEFDPLLKTTEKVEAEALKTVKAAISNKDSVVLVASSGKRMVGFVKADLVDRVYYEPRKEGAIVEFYILPEYRRGNLGRDLFFAMVEDLKKRGAVLITAEFPSQNEIAKKFYTKLGFRAITNVYAKSYF